MKLKETKGDLFSCDQRDALVHCVSADMHMGKGIATEFKKRFGGVRELLDQKCDVGDVAVLYKKNRYIFYLVTKKKYYHKPAIGSLLAALVSLKNHCVEKEVKSLSMPRLGCGLDGLDWDNVKDMIHSVFSHVDIDLNVYYL